MSGGNDMKSKLAHLTKSEKLELLDLLNKKEVAAKLNRPTYVPNDGQMAVHACDDLQRFVFTGNGGGKTTLMVNEMWWAAQGYNPITKKSTYVPSKIYCVLDRPEKVETVLLPEMRKWFVVNDDQLHKAGKPYISKITFKNGSVIHFIFHEMAELAVEGTALDWLFVDEPCPRHLYIGLRRGGRQKGRMGRVLFCGTPLAAPWLRTEIYEPWVKGELTNLTCFRFQTQVNKSNLADGYIEEFSKSLTDKEKKIRLEGEFFDLDGNAFGHVWKRDVHVIEDFEWDKNWPCVVAIDPHPSKSHHAVMVGADSKNRLYVIKEMAVRGAALDFAREFVEWAEGYRIIDIVCDSLGNTPQTGGDGFKSFIQVIRDNGIMARGTTYDEKRHDEWVDRIQTSLKIPDKVDNFGQMVPKLRYFKSCRGSIKDTENCQWVKVKNIDLYKPQLDMVNTDYLSCIKYALSTNISIDKADKKTYYRDKPVTTYGQQPSKWQRLLNKSRKTYSFGDSED